MKTFLIAGAGRQATACAAFLLEQFDGTRVLFVDRDADQLMKATACQQHPERIERHLIDGRLSDPRLTALFPRADCIVSCLPYFMNAALTELAIAHRTHYCDLGGNKATVQKQLRYDDDAKTANVSVIPDCGLDPGTGNVLPEYWKDEWTYRSVSIRCGGLPQRPSNMLNYALVFSPWGLFNEYFDECEVSRGGRLITIEGLSEIETIDDLPISGTFEAFATSGGTSIAAAHYAPLGVDYEYKTIRYPGHRDMIACMRELGFFDERTSATRADGTLLGASMREIAVGAFERALPADRNDLVMLRVDVCGEKDGQRMHGRIDLLDRATDRFTAMERTTGFSIAIVAALQAGLYPARVKPGVQAPFQAVPPKLLIDEHKRAGVTGFTISTEASGGGIKKGIDPGR